MYKVEKAENVEISAYRVSCYVATATRTCTCKMGNLCAERRHFHFFCIVFVGTLQNAIFSAVTGVLTWNKECFIRNEERKRIIEKWKLTLKWRWNNYVTNTMWFMITGALLAQIRLFGFSLRFNYLEPEWLKNVSLSTITCTLKNAFSWKTQLHKKLKDREILQLKLLFTKQKSKAWWWVS
jgi:hypothetical protein